MSTLSPSSANPSSSTHPQRPPPPSLFLGPPSRNASNISLNPPAPSASTQSRPTASRSTRGAPDSIPLGRSRPPLAQSQTEGDRTESLWAEMQATLAEVELSASSSTHVFGAEHSAAMEELREAQIALARAWERSEEVDAADAADADGEIKGGEKEGKGKDAAEEEKETEEADILVARKRREANERFFARVAEGVQDVVGKLEGVAGAMGRVERESRDVWSGSESLGTTGTGSGSVGS